MTKNTWDIFINFFVDFIRGISVILLEVIEENKP